MDGNGWGGGLRNILGCVMITINKGSVAADPLHNHRYKSGRLRKDSEIDRT